ncbi:MAG: hypothetical protein JSR54_01715, partial [Proteobacteria bacterium]|nr:hypothetical protein [Pseudomonadota bacterium]
MRVAATAAAAQSFSSSAASQADGRLAAAGGIASNRGGAHNAMHRKGGAVMSKRQVRRVSGIAGLLAGALACHAGLALAAPTDWRATVQTFASKHCRNPAWGYSHSSRDYRLAKELAAADGVALDDDVLFAAAYLHDLAAFAPYEKPDVDHADQAA